MLGARLYLDRAAPRLAPAKVLVPAFPDGPFIEPAPGSNCPGRIFGPVRSAPASRFLPFCAAFAFARWRALALVMSSTPFLQSPSRPRLGKATACTAYSWALGFSVKR